MEAGRLWDGGMLLEAAAAALHLRSVHRHGAARASSSWHFWARPPARSQHIARGSSSEGEHGIGATICAEKVRRRCYIPALFFFCRCLGRRVQRRDTNDPLTVHGGRGRGARGDARGNNRATAFGPVRDAQCVRSHASHFTDFIHTRRPYIQTVKMKDGASRETPVPPTPDRSL